MSEDTTDKNLELAKRAMKIIGLLEENKTLRDALRYAQSNNGLSDHTTKIVDMALKGKRHGTLDSVDFFKICRAVRIYRLCMEAENAQD